MRRFAIALFIVAAFAPPVFAQSTPASPAPAPSASAAPADPLAAFAEGMRAYHAALAARRLGSREAMSLDDVRARLADAEELVRTGRLDEAVARLTELVELPAFEPFAQNAEGRAAAYLLGDALTSAGAYAPAR